MKKAVKKKNDAEGTKAKAPGAPRRVLVGTLVALGMAFAFLVAYTNNAQVSGKEITLDHLYRLAERSQVVSAKLLDQDAKVTGVACDQAVTSNRSAGAGDFLSVDAPATPVCAGRTTSFHASYPSSDVATAALIDALAGPADAPVAAIDAQPVTPAAVTAQVVVDKQSTKAVARLVSTFLLPLVMLANLFALIFFSKSGDTAMGELARFGRLRARRKGKGGPETSFADVAGADEAVAELREVTDYLRDPARFAAYGAAAPKGVLLFGPPGCGKTLLARAVAGESGVAFFSISGAEFVESLVGVGAARVRDLFRQVREVAPAIVFIDEIDAVGRRRGGEGDSGGEREQTLNQLLVELDGFEVSAGIVLMGATNRPDILDPALLRPGRFDRHVTLETPDVAGRQAILELHARTKPLAPDVEFEDLARRTPGFTGADLANVVNEAALLAIRGAEAEAEAKTRTGAKDKAEVVPDSARITVAHLSEAVVRVSHGPQRKGRIMTAEERKRLAYHESGHAIVATALGMGGDVHRVSIVARGRSLGQTASSEADRVLHTAPELHSELAVALAGVAAEELVFSTSSTAAADDIATATARAREMVGRYGMSERMGRVALLHTDGGYLGDGAHMDAISGTTMADFDAEVAALLAQAEATADGVLSARRTALEAMAAALEAEETLDGTTLANLLASVGPELNGFAAPAPRRAAPRRKGSPSTAP